MTCSYCGASGSASTFCTGRCRQPSLRDELRAIHTQLGLARERAVREGAGEVVAALDHAIPWTHTAREKAYYAERERGN